MGAEENESYLRSQINYRKQCLYYGAKICSSGFLGSNVREMSVFSKQRSISEPSHLPNRDRFLLPFSIGRKVVFELPYWQKVAARVYPNGLPEPESDDPTQWLFHGRPEESTAPLQVAVARLLGYRWPAELDEKMRLSKRARALVKRCEELARLADDDGIVCIPSVRGEEPAAERLEELLIAAGIKPGKARELACWTELDDWLRNSFFEEHCKLFHDRPFVWHIWDGRKRDGFHALINSHRVCEGRGKGRKLLESLTYAYLGEWITRQKDGVKRGEGGADDRLAAALELQKRLEAILEGAPPFDLFVRWKPLAEQPIGWEPDINDGVRMNIRPFLASDLPNGRAAQGCCAGNPISSGTKTAAKNQLVPRKSTRGSGTGMERPLTSWAPARNPTATAGMTATIRTRPSKRPATLRRW
jgi:hypothetical protein